MFTTIPPILVYYTELFLELPYFVLFACFFTEKLALNNKEYISETYRKYRKLFQHCFDQTPKSIRKNTLKGFKICLQFFPHLNANLSCQAHKEKTIFLIYLNNFLIFFVWHVINFKYNLASFQFAALLNLLSLSNLSYL